MSVEAVSLPVPKVRQISAIRGEDMGCIINMDERLRNHGLHRLLRQKDLRKLLQNLWNLRNLWLLSYCVR